MKESLLRFLDKTIFSYCGYIKEFPWYINLYRNFVRFWNYNICRLLSGLLKLLRVNNPEKYLIKFSDKICLTYNFENFVKKYDYEYWKIEYRPDLIE